MPTEDTILASANPYGKFLANQNPQEVIAATPEQLASTIGQVGAGNLERSYAPGKWSVRQILCHLADCEIAFAFRLRQALAEPHHVIQPFDQELWAKSYTALDAQMALHVFSTLRHWNLALIQTVSSNDRAKPVSHPERGEMTFQTILETMAGHDLNHLRQLQTIAASPEAQ